MTLFWRREPIESYIDVGCYFKGWWGKRWQQTNENAVGAADYLLGIEPLSERITTQLNAAISRIHWYQAASVLILLADLASPLLFWKAGYSVREPTNRLAVYALLAPPGVAAVINVKRLDCHKYFYREIINSLRSRVAGRQGTRGLEEHLDKMAS